MIESTKDVSLLVCRVAFDLISLFVLVFLVLPCRAARALGFATQTWQRTFRSILITGASTGIGAELAFQYAGAGVSLVLTARKDTPNLRLVAERCREKGATVTLAHVDVANGAKMRRLIEKCDACAPLDLVVANAGIVQDLPNSVRVFKTNVLGLAHTLIPAAEFMCTRGAGQLVVVSSLGGYAPTTNRFMTAYNASKAAANSYARGLRASLAAEGVGVTVCCPGFVKSSMTENLSAKGVEFYGLWDTERACAAMITGIAYNTAEVSFPTSLYIVTRLLGAAPPWLLEALLPVLTKGDPFAVLDRHRSARTRGRGRHRSRSPAA